MTRLLRAGCLLAILVFVASAWPTLPSMVDDAYVSLRYARHLALGNGLVYNAGQPPVEGYTNLLWVLWMAPGTVLPLHPSTWATGWGLAFGALALVNATGLASVLCGRGSPWALVPAAILAPLPVFAIAATNGLETAMYVALLLGAAWAAVDGRRPVLAGFLTGLLYLVRPEGLVAGGALALFAAGRAWRTRTPPGLRAAATPLVAFGLVVVPYFLARWAYFGTLVPNTFAAQAREPFLDMFTMNRGYYARSAELYGGALVLWALSLALRPRRAGQVVLLFVAAGLALVSMRVYNWMPGARLFLAPIALVACAATPMVQALRPGARAGLGGALALGILWLTFGPSRRIETRYDQRNTALPGNEAERMGRRIAAVAPPGAWLLARDAGVVPYFAGPAVNVVDIHPFSLTDPHLTAKPFDPDYVLGKEPAFLVTTATTSEELPTIYQPERVLLRDRRVAGHYTRTADAYQHYRRWYALWVREDLAPALQEAGAAPVGAASGRKAIEDASAPPSQ